MVPRMLNLERVLVVTDRLNQRPPTQQDCIVQQQRFTSLRRTWVPKRTRRVAKHAVACNAAIIADGERGGGHA